jgi:methyl-accepting chemotaxis protein
MRAETLPAPLLPLPAADPARPARTRTDLGARVVAAFTAILLLLVPMTALVAIGMEGPLAVAAVGLGVAAIVGTLLIAAWILQRLVRPLGPLARGMARLGAGDLTGTVDARAGGELRAVLQSMQEVRERLSTAVSQVRTASLYVATNVTQITRDNESLAHRTETQAESLQETAASMEQLTAAVRQTAGTAQEANALVRDATGRAEQGGEVMREVVETMHSIRGSSQSIREIIGVIDGIAFQTNILALNAAVEAARAGEQGRGFAVVAAEVRSLSQRCAAAAREIRELIAASVDKVDRGGARVDEAGQAMQEIVAAVRQVAELIARINGAAQEQSGGIETINAAVSRIDGTTQDNAALVKAASRTADALQERMATLVNAVAAFRLDASEHGSAQEAIALVQGGAGYLRQRGREALLAEVNKLEKGRFVDRDLFLMITDLHAVFLAHGNNPGRIGVGPDLQDLAGRYFVREMVRAARERGAGWVDYRWKHSITGQAATRSAYVLQEGGLVIACAIYKD